MRALRLTLLAVLAFVLAPPWILHEDSDLIAEGDYETLMNVLRTSFEGTPQPLPGTRGVSIWYVEDGFQTVAPPDKRCYYRGRENDLHAVPALAPQGEIAVVDQATQLRDPILLAYCQPAVTGFLNFGLLDEDRLGGWQSGLLWRDGSRKPSYDASSRRSPRSAGGIPTAARSAGRPAG